MGRVKPLSALAFAALLVIVAFIFLARGAPGATAPPPQNAPAAPAPPPAGCGDLTVYVLNVSQADSIFIITPGNRTILIDAGSKMKANSSSNAISFLKRMNVTRIDYLVASHYHEDHIGGMDSVFKGFQVGSVYDNGNCAGQSSATAKTFGAYAALYGSTAVSAPVDIPPDGCLSEAKLLFPYNQAGGCSKGDENDNSVLLHLVYGNTSFLFTGDCDEACESALLQQGVSLKSDFLKVGHHGSYTSSSVPFLDAVGARYYVISADLKRSVTDGYFHPREATLEKLYASSPDGVFRTDLNGDVRAVSDGSGIAVSPDSASGECDTFRGYTSADAGSYSLIPQLDGKCA